MTVIRNTALAVAMLSASMQGFAAGAIGGKIKAIVGNYYNNEMVAIQFEAGWTGTGCPGGSGQGNPITVFLEPAANVHPIGGPVTEADIEQYKANVSIALMAFALDKNLSTLSRPLADYCSTYSVGIAAD